MTEQRTLFSVEQGQGETLLMIHGIISDHTFFDETAGYLSSMYRVISYDRCGYGESTPGDTSMTAQAEDVYRVLAEHHVDRTWILGNSAGGLIAIEFALRHPEMVRGMILMEPSLNYTEESERILGDWNTELNALHEAGKDKRALPVFSRVIGASETGPAKGQSMAEMKKTYANLKNFMSGELNDVQHYAPPAEILRNWGIPCLVAVTERGRQSIFAISSIQGAEVLGWPIVSIPGYHNTAKDMPREFAMSVHGMIEGIRHGWFAK